jgi:DNA-binding IclR family transcriptional regulator
MRRLADETGQSCNLSVMDVDRVRVVAQAESPGDFGFRVRVGATFSVEETATGAVLRAFGGQGVVEGVRGGPASGEAVGVLAGIRDRGHLERADALQPSITDVVFPILGASGAAVAALTVPYVATSFSAVSAERVREAAGRAAGEISASLGL